MNDGKTQNAGVATDSALTSGSENCCGSCLLFSDEDMYGNGWCPVIGRTTCGSLCSDYLPNVTGEAE